MRCRRRRSSRAAEDFVQRRVISFQVRSGVIHRHAALLEKRFRLPVVEAEHFADLPMRKAPRAITLNCGVFQDVATYRLRGFSDVSRVDNAQKVVDI